MIAGLVSDQRHSKRIAIKSFVCLFDPFYQEGAGGSEHYKKVLKETDGKYKSCTVGSKSVCVCARFG